jgi:hypothetical protein
VRVGNREATSNVRVDVQRTRLLIPVVLFALVAAGCGSDEDAADVSTIDAAAATTTSPSETTAPATTAEPPTTSAADSTIGSEAGDQPIVGGGTAPSSELEITIWPEGRDGEPTTYTLTCMPDGGTHPDLAAACQAVYLPMVFDPPPTDQACTEQYGGPQVAEVTGRVQDIAIDARFSRTDGCQISRWERASALLPLPDGSGTDAGLSG